MRFTTDEDYFERWKTVLNERVNDVVKSFSHVEGVKGLILAGSLGRGKPWPLSDIDIIPIYDSQKAEIAQSRIVEKRLEWIEYWEREGWRTALDVGSLAFTCTEVDAVIRADQVVEALADNRWFYCLDKGYQGRAVYDADGLANPLAQWFTTNRFKPEVIEFRLNRHWQMTEYHNREFMDEINRMNLLKASQALGNGVGAFETYLLEKWGKRDNSFARFGTRFERVAQHKNQNDLVESLNDLCNLNDEQVLKRIELAPDWIQQRHQRSWRARRMIGEDVTKIQDARDVLRVFSRYERMKQTDSPYPAWLAVDTDLAMLESKCTRFMQILNEIICDQN